MSKKVADKKNEQLKFKSHLGEMKKENKKDKSKEQKNALYNIEMLIKQQTVLSKFMMIIL